MKLGSNSDLFVYYSIINPFVLFFQLDNLESILGGLRNSGSGMFADSGTGGMEGGNKQGNGPNSTAHGESQHLEGLKARRGC